ncbi:MAG: Bax inhibitor-1 family protein [Armatimonadetes bacterium]|nr:Bax inhibitor-1 family protein [Armatimonadota bacterium]
MNVGSEYTNVMAAALERRLPFVQKVYGLFLAGILVSIAAAAYMLGGPQLRMGDLVVPARVMGAVNSYGVIIIAFFISFFVASAVRRKPVINLVMMFVFTAISGAMIAPRLWISTVEAPGTVPLAGALTAVAFATLTLYAMLSRRSFSFLGAGLTIALLGLIIGGLLNSFFFHSPAAHLFMAWGAVVIFSGFILYDTSVILRNLDDEEYVAGALSLYLDFINLFLAILRILGGNRR